MVDDPLVISEDWRLYACTRITAITNEPSDGSWLVGDAIKPVTNVLYGRDRLVLDIPNGTALYLNVSFKQYEVAKKLLMSSVLQGVAATGHCVPDQAAFDFLEAIISAVVFAYTALESFANAEIPEDFYFEKKYKGVWLALGKKSIEQTVDLQTKLKHIIPKVHKLQSISDTPIWAEFLDLEETRNRIIHLKTLDQQALAEETGSIWHKLFTPNLICPHYVAKSLMLHYYAQMKHKPRWSHLVPF